MKMNGHIHKTLANYVSDNPGTKADLARILMQRPKARPLSR
jgi:hypothetical protein